MAVPSFSISETEKKKIIEKLTEKGVRPTCPMCSQKNFVLADGYFNHPLQGSLQAGLTIGGPAIPTIAIICANCGFVSEHALGVLGLLPSTEGGTE